MGSVRRSRRAIQFDSLEGREWLSPVPAPAAESAGTVFILTRFNPRTNQFILEISLRVQRR